VLLQTLIAMKDNSTPPATSAATTVR